MVDVEYKSNFEKEYFKKDKSTQKKIHKQIEKIINFPEIGKPMKHSRKGTIELYVPPFRISYKYIKDENLIIFLEIYHKDEQ